jgi:calpain-15
MILEKAWAKISGSYSNIISGTPREVIRSLTGCPTLSLRTESPEFLKDFENYVKTKCIMTSGSLSRQGNGLLKEAEKLGLVPGHAYSILKIREIIHPQKG